MKVNGNQYQSIWVDRKNPTVICCIDQRYLPFRFVIEELRTVEDVCRAIRDMHLRGAPLIGVAAAFGLYLSALEHAVKSDLRLKLNEAACSLLATRPTAINLQAAIERQLLLVGQVMYDKTSADVLLNGAMELWEEERQNCIRIGEHGLSIIEKIAEGKKEVNILTHCNAGWLACVDYGTATAPIYMAHDKGIQVHVWVDETRPRNQGSRLTAWELGQHGVPHTVIADNAGGLLMQQGKVDLVIVGSDRTTRNGDVANKIGTYLKALAAKDNNIPFYVALPSTSIDWKINDAFLEIPIETRAEDEVHFVEGLVKGSIVQVRVTPENSKALNYSFDITPARLITGLITERGCCDASRAGIASLFPEIEKLS